MANSLARVFQSNEHAKPHFDKMEGNQYCWYIEWRLPKLIEEEALPDDDKVAKAQFESSVQSLLNRCDYNPVERGRVDASLSTTLSRLLSDSR